MSQITPDRREEITRPAQKGVSAETISMAIEAQRWPVEIIDHEEKRECRLSYLQGARTISTV
jgi:hypothetical protein